MTKPAAVFLQLVGAIIFPFGFADPVWFFIGFGLLVAGGVAIRARIKSDKEEVSTRSAYKAGAREFDHAGNLVAGEKADTVACPFCAEDIKAAAIVCKHCGRDLPGKSG